MATRLNMGIMAWIGVLIVLGLIITHAKGFSEVAGSSFSGISGIIKDLQTPGGQQGYSAGL